MRKIYLLALVVGLGFSFCSKSSVNPDPNQPTGVDTLTEGWSATVITGRPALNDVFFSDAMKGYACGPSGLYKSADGGVSWSFVSSPAYNLFNIGASSLAATFVNGTSKAFITSDGIQVDTVIHPTLQDISFSDVFYATPSICYLSSIQYCWRSVDAGRTIDTVFNFGGSSSGDNTLFFINANTGWINRSGQLYRTTNGGSNWQLMQNMYGATGGLDFVNEMVGFFSIAPDVYKTVDGGLTVSTIFSVPGSVFGLEVDFVSESIGYLAKRNQVLKTTNGGATWQVVAALASGEPIIELHFLDEHTGWACGQNGKILRYSR